MADISQLADKNNLMRAVDIATTGKGALYLAKEFADMAERYGLQKVEQVEALVGKLFSHAEAVQDAEAFGYDRIHEGIMPVRPGEGVEEAATETETAAEAAKVEAAEAVEEAAPEAFEPETPEPDASTPEAHDDTTHHHPDDKETPEPD